MDDARLQYLDNLRALALLAGVAFHAALAYSPLAQPFFPTADRASSMAVDVAAWFLHLFRMPLFFVIAGYFTALQVARRGMGGMFRSRLFRIGLPLIVLTPLINAWLKATTLRAAGQVEHPSQLLMFLRDLLQQGELPPIPPGTGHLWFLAYLMLFVVLAWIARALELERIGRWLAALHPAWPLFAWPLLLVPAMRAVPAPHPAPESLLPQFWAMAYFGSFFLFGYLMHASPQLARCHERRPGVLALAGVVAYAGYFFLLDAPDAWPRAWLGAATSVWITIACLVAGRAWLDREHRVLRSVADGSYWTYVVHLPVLFPIQYALMDVDAPWPAKFAIGTLLTLAICLASYRLIVTRTQLSKIFGRGAVPVRRVVV